MRKEVEEGRFKEGRKIKEERFKEGKKEGRLRKEGRKV